MKSGTIPAMVLTGLVVLIVGSVTGVCGLMMWALALNGFMGQQRAVDTSLYSFIGLAALAVIAMSAVGVAAVYYFTNKRNWNAVGAAILSMAVCGATTGVLHVLVLILSVIIADQLRTNR